MEEFENIKEAIEVIEKNVEIVNKKHLAAFHRVNLNSFEKTVSDLRVKALELQFELQE